MYEIDNKKISEGNRERIGGCLDRLEIASENFMNIPLEFIKVLVEYFKIRERSNLLKTELSAYDDEVIRYLDKFATNRVKLIGERK